MEIAIESDVLIPSVFEALSVLMNRARVCIDNMHYDPENGVVKILMQRYELTGYKKSVLGVEQPIYGKTRIDTLLTINQVVDMKLKVDDVLVTDCNSCFTILFGLHVDGNEFYLGSAEEDEGRTLCQVFITVTGINIELTDRVQK
jgi:hypothetical protein